MSKVKVAGIILLVMLVPVLLASASLGWRWATASIKGKVEKREEVQSGHSRIVNYEKFFDLCSSIQRYNQTLKAQQELLKAAETKRERARIRSNIAGLKAQKADTISRYNANARKNKTRGQFRDKGLPAHINLGQENVTCR